MLCAADCNYAGRNWTRAHRRWIDSLGWAQPAERVVIDLTQTPQTATREKTHQSEIRAPGFAPIVFDVFAESRRSITYRAQLVP